MVLNRKFISPSRSPQSTKASYISYRYNQPSLMHHFYKVVHENEYSNEAFSIRLLNERFFIFFNKKSHQNFSPLLL